MIEIFPVKKRHLSVMWPYAMVYIKLAMKFAPETPPSLFEIYLLLVDSKLQLWIGWRGKEIIGAGLTEISLEGEEKICWIYAVGGELNGEFELCRERVSSWAKVTGCSAVRIRGRKGWKRIFKDMVEIKPGVLEKRL